MYDLRDILRDEPEVNIQLKFLKNYTQRITIITGLKVMLLIKKSAPRILVFEFCIGLDFVKIMTIVSLLFDKVVALLIQFLGVL